MDGALARTIRIPAISFVARPGYNRHMPMIPIPRLRQQYQFSSGSMNSSSKSVTSTDIRNPLHTGASMQPEPVASGPVGGGDGTDEEVEPAPSDIMIPETDRSRKAKRLFTVHTNKKTGGKGERATLFTPKASPSNTTQKECRILGVV